MIIEAELKKLIKKEANGDSDVKLHLTIIQTYRSLVSSIAFNSYGALNSSALWSSVTSHYNELAGDLFDCFNKDGDIANKITDFKQKITDFEGKYPPESRSYCDQIFLDTFKAVIAKHGYKLSNDELKKEVEEFEVLSDSTPRPT